MHSFTLKCRFSHALVATTCNFYNTILFTSLAIVLSCFQKKLKLTNQSFNFDLLLSIHNKREKLLFFLICIIHSHSDFLFVSAWNPTRRMFENILLWVVVWKSNHKQFCFSRIVLCFELFQQCSLKLLCRSTKSEKMYPSMLSRGPDIETEPYYCLPVSGAVAWSQPTSPSPRGLTGLLSPTHTNHRLIYQKKNDEGKNWRH